jgi:hypothetical protein
MTYNPRTTKSASFLFAACKSSANYTYHNHQS